MTMYSLTTIAITLTTRGQELDSLFNEEFYKLLSSKNNVQVESNTTEFRQGYVCNEFNSTYRSII
jgi:patatin-like phospholipase/acyl hydrolase